MNPFPTQQPPVAQPKRPRLLGWGCGLALLLILGLIFWSRCGPTISAGLEKVRSFQSDFERTSEQVQSSLAGEVELEGLTFTVSTYGKEKPGLVVSWFPRSNLSPSDVRAVNQRVCSKLGNGVLAPQIDVVVAVAIQRSELSVGPMTAGSWRALAECSAGAPLTPSELKELASAADPTW